MNREYYQKKFDKALKEFNQLSVDPSWKVLVEVPLSSKIDNSKIGEFVTSNRKVYGKLKNTYHNGITKYNYCLDLQKHLYRVADKLYSCV